MVDQGSQMAGNWERRRPEEGGGWETLYDKDGFAYYYSHYTGEQTYSMPKEYAHAQGIMTVSRPITCSFDYPRSDRLLSWYMGSNT